jgi:hypothetical protein
MLENVDLFNYYGLDWLGMFFLLIGVYFLSEQKKTGFIYSGISNVFWVIFGAFSDSIPTILLNLGLLGLNIRGFISWK